jgi:hypothetical protein
MDALHQFHPAEFMPALRAADDCQAFFFGKLRCCHNFPTAGHVGRYGLFGEDVFASLDSSHHLSPSKSGRRCHKQQIRLTASYFLMTIEAPKQMVIIDLYPAFVFFISGDPVPCASDFVLEQVSQGYDFDTGIGIKVLAKSTVAPSAAAEQSDFYLARALCVDNMSHRAGQRRGASGCSHILSRFTFIFI